MTVRLLPIGTQDFEIIRKNGFLYVDKTAMIYNLVKTGRIYFLSRPRRFGKSLLVSTLDAYFSGKRGLFDGLAMADLEKEWTEYPVIRIDFSRNSYKRTKNFEETMDAILSKYEERFGVCPAPGVNPANRLHDVIVAANEMTGKQAVVLVDEYDKPILDALYEPNEDENREILRSFYSPLKECDARLKFVLLTGITKVSHVNIFSGLNQLNDISLNDDFAALCGITAREIRDNFSEEVKVLARANKITKAACLERLKDEYDGYRFSSGKVEVYNPFCLLSAFYNRKFSSYWANGSAPTMLVRALENYRYDIGKMILDRGYVSDGDFMSDYDPLSADLTPILYQSGYLTIRDYDADEGLYRLGFPNREVEVHLLKHLLPRYVASGHEDDIGLSVEKIREAINANDTQRLMAIVSSCIWDIPTVMKEDDCENYYETAMHILFRVTGYVVNDQMPTVCGRSDIVVRSRRSVYVFELKMDGGRTDLDGIYKDALRQIDDKGYAKVFEASGLPIHRVAVVFSSAKKGISGYLEA